MSYFCTPQVPEHLREDFCGTALLASTWCRGDIARRTGMGLDIDRDALSWGMQHNGEGLTDTPQPCLWLLHGDVTQPLEKAVLVNCPVSSHSSDGGDSSQPSVEQSVQDMSINATGAAANGLNCSSGRQLDTASTEQAPITDAVHSSNNNEHRDSAQASSVSVPLSDHSRSGLQAKPLHQRSTEHPTGYPQEGNLMHHGSGSNGAHLSCSSRDRAEGCRAADIICAFNFSVCLLHKRSEVQVTRRLTKVSVTPHHCCNALVCCKHRCLSCMLTLIRTPACYNAEMCCKALTIIGCVPLTCCDSQAYFRQSRQALSRRGGILVMDLLGGHAAEESLLMHRHNDTTGARFVWEQEKFNPVTRHIDCYITLRDPDTQKVLLACPYGFSPRRRSMVISCPQR